MDGFRRLKKNVSWVTIMLMAISLPAFAMQASKSRLQKSPVFTAVDQAEYQFDKRTQTYLDHIVENWQLGIKACRGEWSLICATHNLLKLWRSKKACWN